VHWVDVTPASREGHKDWVAADGLHPAAAQYARWAELAFDAAASALKN
jgi:lysophospholipase L1-like esterase